MDNVLIRFRLISEEAHALSKLAANELRHPRDQVRYILRKELKRLGFLQSESDLVDQKENADETAT